jgi:hypothetical protein
VTATATTANAKGAPALPDYAPVPPSALRPDLNEQGCSVGRVERNLFWVTDGTYQSTSAPARRSTCDRGGFMTRVPEILGPRVPRTARR